MFIISGSDLPTIISNFGHGLHELKNGVQTIIVIPSGSSMTGVPTSMTDGFGGSTVRICIITLYRWYRLPLGGTTSIIHTLDVDGTKEGFDKCHCNRRQK